ncbi:MAG TPA: hypothetical protein VGR47_13550 [Terracidiphilus sp.]|nr:hypothetical protein [Terracidiphilus sp.]
MQQLSSRVIFYQKVIFPLFWFGFFGFTIAAILFTSHQKYGAPLSALIMPILFLVCGYFIFKKMVWDLADRVFDSGDALIVRFGKEEERIPLSNITNISYSKLMTPTRITLTLRNPGRFGSEVSFAAPFSPWIFSKSRIVADLIQRVDAARRAAGTSV